MHKKQTFRLASAVCLPRGETGPFNLDKRLCLCVHTPTARPRLLTHKHTHALYKYISQLKYLDNKRSERAEGVREKSGALVAGERVQQHLQHAANHIVLALSQRHSLQGKCNIPSNFNETKKSVDRFERDLCVMCTCMMVSSRSRTMRLLSVARFPLMRASWSNSALVLIDRRERTRAGDSSKVKTTGKDNRLKKNKQ